MAGSLDFRLQELAVGHIKRAGRFLGHSSYWKLYVFENILRVVVSSILTVELHPSNWWDVAVDKDIRKNVDRFRNQYSKQAWRSNPGKHGIYYVSLSDLNEIMRANVDVLGRVIPEVHEWLLRIEKLKIPRNMVAHMNYPIEPDLDLIDELYDLSVGLIPQLEKKRVKPTIP